MLSPPESGVHGRSVCPVWSVQSRERPLGSPINNIAVKVQEDKGVHTVLLRRVTAGRASEEEGNHVAARHLTPRPLGPSAPRGRALGGPQADLCILCSTLDVLGWTTATQRCLAGFRSATTDKRRTRGRKGKQGRMRGRGYFT